MLMKAPQKWNPQQALVETCWVPGQHQNSGATAGQQIVVQQPGQQQQPTIVVQKKGAESSPQQAAIVAAPRRGQIVQAQPMVLIPSETSVPPPEPPKPEVKEIPIEQKLTARCVGFLG